MKVVFCEPSMSLLYVTMSLPVVGSQSQLEEPFMNFVIDFVIIMNFGINVGFILDIKVRVKLGSHRQVDFWASEFTVWHHCTWLQIGP